LVVIRSDSLVAALSPDSRMALVCGYGRGERTPWRRRRRTTFVVHVAR
jgi:hypothetical protein